MTRSPTWLAQHARKAFSQSGEDGIIEKILEMLPDRDGWCVEFGAWDGMFASNTRNLIEAKGYSAVLIEADPRFFGSLQRNYAGRHNVITVNARVGFQEDDNLDRLLSTTPAPLNFDVLSVDIDGNDYHAWNATHRYRPKAVVIEFNETIPTPVRFVQAADHAVAQGASLLSLVELGREKGYELVSVLPSNAIFVREEYYPCFDLESNDPELLRTHLDSVTYLFQGFDGRLLLSGCRKLPWHDITLDESRIQQLPRVLQKYPGNYTGADKWLFFVFLLLTRPRQFVERLRNRLGLA